MTSLHRSAGVLLLALTGCATPAPRADADAAPPPALDAARAEVDASTPRDASTPGPVDGGAARLVLGRCVKPSGEDCAGDTGDGRFVPIDAESVVPIVIGFQGSPMFVLALEARGIDPGDPDAPLGTDNPFVELQVFDDAGRQVAGYRDRAPLQPEPGGGVGLSHFVVLELATSEVEGAALRADAWLRDRYGVEVAASARFVAGPAPRE